MKLSKQFLLIVALSTLSFQGCSRSTESRVDASYELSEISNDEDMVSEVHAEKMMASRDMQSDEAMPAQTVQFTPPVLKSSTPTNYIPTLATSGVNDGDKKFIRTASLSFKVADIPQATYTIENIIIQKKGFIINSEIRDQYTHSNEQRISKDSILISTYNKLSATMTLRVHHSLLDATLREIAPLAEVIRYRTVNANDVTLTLLSEKLKSEREKKKGQRISSITGNNKGHKLNDLLDAEESINRANQAIDDALISKLSVEDQIEYSTISILLEQDPIVITKVKLREKDVVEYKPSFLHNVVNALDSGWKCMLEVIALLISIWPVILFVVGGVFVFRYFRKKRKTAE